MKKSLALPLAAVTGLACLLPMPVSAASDSTAVTLSQRIKAATDTAGNDLNACADVRPFYWEVGDRKASRASGSVRLADDERVIGATTPMLWASASKWLYGAYVVQKRAGKLNHADVQMLTMRSGFANMGMCRSGQTVDACLAWQDNGAYMAESDGRFDYNGGHMQVHASLNGLGAMSAAALTTELKRQLGSDVGLSMRQAQPAGGAAGTPASYARFLRKLLDGRLKMGAMLGQHAVCASSEGCGADQSRFSPSPDGETLHYALGHWVEDDPERGDGAFSSGGAFGFYPWIDADRRFYGIVARQEQEGGPGSVQCGRLIRQAWSDGVGR